MVCSVGCGGAIREGANGLGEVTGDAVTIHPFLGLVVHVGAAEPVELEGQGDEILEGQVVDVNGKQADVELDEGVLIIVPISMLSKLNVDDEHVEKLLQGEDTVKILDEMVREETLQKV